MATIIPTSDDISGNKSVIRRSWALLTTTDNVGSPFPFAEWADRSIQVTGTFGAGGNLKWEGSNDGTNYYVLTDPQGNALDITTAKIEAITEICAFARPRVSAGDGTTSLTVTLIARRQK